MQGEFFKEYSMRLERDMCFQRFGFSGVPILAFPSQDGDCDNFNSFGMVDCIADYVHSGKVQVFTCDGIDKETWSDKGGDPAYRAALQEKYYHYIVDELIPRIYEITSFDGGLLTTGCSLGATHAANVFFRRPDLFDGVIAMSGLYNTDYFFDGYMDDNLYVNSPESYLANMAEDHYYIDMYNSRFIVLCCGQGAWEDEMLASQYRLRPIFEAKGINVWQDIWGEDVNHDWPWWRRQFPYFLAKYFE